MQRLASAAETDRDAAVLAAGGPAPEHLAAGALPHVDAPDGVVHGGHVPDGEAGDGVGVDAGAGEAAHRQPFDGDVARRRRRRRRRRRPRPRRAVSGRRGGAPVRGAARPPLRAGSPRRA